MFGRRRVDRQRQVGIELAEEKPGASGAAEQVRVLANPAESGIASERFFQHRRRVDERAIAERPNLPGDAVGEPLQAAAQELVIVAPKRVARHVAQFGLLENVPGIASTRRVVVHPHRNDAHGAGQQLVRAAALDAMSGHVVHLSVAFGGQPVKQVRFVCFQVDRTDAHLLESTLGAPAPDIGGKVVVVDIDGIERRHGVSGSGELRQYNRGMDTTALYTVAQVRALDRAAIDRHGIAGYELMQRAAAAAFAHLRKRWPQARRIVVLCGSGNNGGDGYVLARLALAAGLDVSVIAAEPVRNGGDAALAHAAWIDAGGRILDASSSLPEGDVYVDALFGTGLTRAAQGIAQDLIERVNAAKRPTLALDVPSGVDADTGNVPGSAVHAAATITFVARKRGLFTGAARDCCGEITLDDLAVPAAVLVEARADAGLLEADAIKALLPPRAPNAHKGNFGHVLAIGGDLGFGGAIRLASEAALRVGAGLVSVATRAEQVGSLNAARPELMASGVGGPQELEALLQRASVIALGPGLGQRAWGHALWHTAIAAGKPVVLDADGLNLLARDPLALPADTVLTPHPGEAARLLGCDTQAIAADRFAAVREIARRHQCVCVLKGAGTLVASPHGEVAVCPWGNPGMASGGMGDVLTGVIAGLLAQGLDAWRAACAGVALHARAGDVAARDGQSGLLASDLFGPLRALRNGVAEK